jgi:hypothetical protein
MSPTYENRTTILKNQDYLFAKQLSRMRRLIGHVDYIITDSPLIQYIAYIPENFELPSLKPLIIEARNIFHNVDVYLNRCVPYQEYGRFQTIEQAQQIDTDTVNILDLYVKDYIKCDVHENTAEDIFNLIVTNHL